MEARLLSEADERSQDKVRVMRLTNHTPNTMQQLASSKEAEDDGYLHRGYSTSFFRSHFP